MVITGVRKRLDKRAHIKEETKRQLSKFFGGLGCAVTGSPIMGASIHHVNGDRSFSELPNLLPLAADLHNGLIPGELTERFKRELSEEYLIEKAREHFQNGLSAKAYGCLRFAHGLAAYFDKKKDLEKELSLASHSLYFLRRAALSSDVDIVYAHLRHLLDRELHPRLRSTKVLPPLGCALLITELGSWLNEFGGSKDGLDVLVTARKRLKPFHSELNEKGRSRLERQIGFALLHQGKTGVPFDNAIKKVIDSGDTSKNNIFSLEALKLSRELDCGRPEKAYDILQGKIAIFEKMSGFGHGPLHQLGQTVQTSLVYMALTVICESYFTKTSRQQEKLQEQINTLRRQEERYGMNPALHLNTVAMNALALPRFKPSPITLSNPVLPSDVRGLVLDVVKWL